MVALSRDERARQSANTGATVSTTGQPIPDVSVVIPTRNRPEKVRACLAALARQTSPASQFEVLVVDDGGNQDLEGVSREFKNRLPVVFIAQSALGPATARNTGAQAARAPLLAFTDDDCEPAPNWLAVLCARHQETPEAAIGGRVINSVAGNVYSEASQLLVDYLYEYHARKQARGPAKPTEAPAFFTSNNLAVRADLYRQVGGFGGSFALAAGEDREFCDRWQQHGLPLRYVPEAIVRHGHVLSLTSFWRQHCNYGHGASDLRQARVERGMPRMKIEPLAFYARLIAYPFTRREARRRLALTALLALSQVANALGFARARFLRR